MIELPSLNRELREAHRLFGDVKALINATLSKCVLFDGVVDGNISKSLLVVLGSGYPALWRDELNSQRDMDKGTLLKGSVCLSGLP